MNYFSSIQEAFGDLPFFQKIILGIECDLNGISLCQVNFSRGVPFVEKAFSLSWDVSDSEEEKAKKLKDKCIQEDIFFRDTVVTIPYNLAIIKYLRIPSIVDGDIAKMVPLQTHRQLPFSEEEVVFDYEVVSRDNDGYSQVMVTMVRQEDLNLYLDVLKKSGITPDKVVLNSDAVFKWIYDAKKEKEHFIALHIDQRFINLGLWSHGHKRLVRPLLNLALKKHFNEQESLQKEIEISLEHIKGENPSSFCPGFILTGDHPSLLKIRDFIDQKFNVKSEVLDPGKDIISSPFSRTALTAAYLLHKDSINLMPYEEKKQKSFMKSKKEWGTFLLLFFMVLGLSGTILSMEINNKKKRLEFLNKKRSELSIDVKTLRRMKKQVEVIRGQVKKEGSLFEVLGVLNEVFPKKTALKTLIYGRENHLLLQGTSFSLSQAVNIVNIIDRTGEFRKVALRSSNVRKLHGRDVVDFEIHCDMSSEKKEKS